MKPVTEHRGWKIYRLTLVTDKQLPIYVAAKNGDVIEGVDLPDLKADIDEAERR